MRPLHILGMRGLGDNIYQRPFVRAASARWAVHLETPWPELYADLPVQVLPSGTRLRTQAANEARQASSVWSERPAGAQRVRVSYGTQAFRRGSLIREMERQLPLAGAPFVFDLPRLGRAPVRSAKPIALVRPVTLRAEWANPARNPRPEYVAEIAADLMATHHVVAVADLADGAEWLVGEAPPHHQGFLNGELNVRQLLALVRAADVVVGGVGWIVPAAVASRTRAFIVLGGQGGHNAPEKITDPRMDLSRIGWAQPRAFCRCELKEHTCRKAIPDLSSQWRTWAASQGLR